MSSSLKQNTTTIQELLIAINNLPEASNGVELPELSNRASAEELFANKELIDETGEIVVGTFTIDTELETQRQIISEIETALTNKIVNTSKPEQEKTIELTENGTTEVAPDEGQVLSKVTVIVNVSTTSTPEVNPADLYQRVEYITSDGDSYFMTDFTAENDCGMEVVASFGSLTDFPFMGSRLDSGDTRFLVAYPLSATTTYGGFNTGIKVTTSGVAADTVYRLQTNFLNSRLINIYDEAGARKGSSTVTGVLTSHTAPISICAYNKIYEGGPGNSRILSLYSARCSKGYEVVREYIPCYRKSDGVIGLYEKNTKQFLTNGGSGTFTKGPDIDW